MLYQLKRENQFYQPKKKYAVIYTKHSAIYFLSELLCQFVLNEMKRISERASVPTTEQKNTWKSDDCNVWK